ncbi:hypothetical protein [Mesorhizobium sp. INR15]|uniref:hypothetical protein n=1 Tax=Mesorhizobium sp. INR15 TaxID=2654248 RepID=UPI0035BBD539
MHLPDPLNTRLKDRPKLLADALSQHAGERHSGHFGPPDNVRQLILRSDVGETSCRPARDHDWFSSRRRIHGSALDDPAKMSPFFTDSGMKTMKSDDDFKKAWMALTDDDRTSMKKDCGDNVIGKSHDDFCKKTKMLGGAN